MNFFDIVKTANQNLMRNKLRSFLTILAIFIGSFSIILCSAINTGVNSFIDRQVESFGGKGYMEVMSATVAETMTSVMSGGDSVTEYNPEKNSSDAMYITDSMVEQARQIEGITDINLSHSASAEYITSSDSDKKYTIRVSEMPSNTITMDLTAGANIDADSDEYQIALTEGYAEALGFDSDENAIGKTVKLAVKNSVTNKITEVDAVVVATQAPSVISMGRSWIAPSLNTKLYELANAGLPSSITSMSLYATADFDPALTDEQVSEIKSQLADIGLTGMTVDDQVGTIKTFFDVITTVFTIFGVIALLAASIGIINTLLMSVQERTREIGLDKALGMSSGHIFATFSFEAISLGFWGSVLGIALSMAAGFAANATFHAPGGFLESFPTFNLVEFTIPNCAFITLVIMLIAFLAGTLPAIKAARKNPIDALRYE